MESDWKALVEKSGRTLEPETNKQLIITTRAATNAALTPVGKPTITFLKLAKQGSPANTFKSTQQLSQLTVGVTYQNSAGMLTKAKTARVKYDSGSFRIENVGSELKFSSNQHELLSTGKITYEAFFETVATQNNV